MRVRLFICKHKTLRWTTDDLLSRFFFLYLHFFCPFKGMFFLYNEYVVWSIDNSSSCSYFHFSLTCNYYSIEHLLFTMLFVFLIFFFALFLCRSHTCVPSAWGSNTSFSSRIFYVWEREQMVVFMMVIYSFFFSFWFNYFFRTVISIISMIGHTHKR